MPDPYRENPTEKKPYTVLCVINPDCCTLVAHTWAYDANDAVDKALVAHVDNGENRHYYERGQVELIGVFYGHVKFCFIEDDFRITWFQFPIIYEVS